MKANLIPVNFKRQWELLVAGHKSNRLAHSYLLAGPKGVGKKKFVLEFAKYLNCLEKKGERACSNCRHCLEIDNNTFIDLKIVEGDFSIEKMKRLKQELIYPPYQAEYRIVLINGVDQIREDAASVFLKTLEEPNKRNIFFLLAENIFQVLPTIKSRCQVLKFYSFSREKELQAEMDPKFQKAFSGLKKMNLIEKFNLVKNLPEEEELVFLETGMVFFKKKFKERDFSDYSKEEIIKILKNFKKIHFLLQKTNVNPRLALEVLLLNT